MQTDNTYIYIYIYIYTYIYSGYPLTPCLGTLLQRFTARQLFVAATPKPFQLSHSFLLLCFVAHQPFGSSTLRILWPILQAFGLVRNMAIHITMQDAFDQASEEIFWFHRVFVFPHALTHHTGRDAPRVMSHQDYDYIDHGNWTGSIMVYGMMFECDPEDSLLRVFDQTGERAVVYQNWGPEGQRSSKGQDNDRTNLLESILNVMGVHGKYTQRAWNLVKRYAMRHPDLSRQQLLHQALVDPSTDMYTHDDAIAETIMDELGRAWDV